MDTRIIKNLQHMLKQYDNICPQHCLHCDCENFENAILLPNEEKLTSSYQELIKYFSKHKDGFFYLNVDSRCPFLSQENCQSKCLMYNQRPIDCRIFPFYPHYNLQNDSYILLKSRIDCPLTREDLTQMETDVRKVLNIINKLAPKSWKEMYNQLNYQVQSLKQYMSV